MADYPDYTGTIDILAQEIGIYIGAEWEVKAGNEKYLQVSDASLVDGDFDYVSYTNLEGKTFYINFLSFMIVASEVANKEKPQMGWATLKNHTDTIYLARLGGNGGNGISFPSPIKIPAGKELRLLIDNYSGHTCWVSATCGGYLV